jgi:hypothetical protein
MASTISQTPLFRLDRDNKTSDMLFLTELKNANKRYTPAQRGGVSENLPEIVQESKLHSEVTLNAAGLHNLGDHKTVSSMFHNSWGILFPPKY